MTSSPVVLVYSIHGYGQYIINHAIQELYGTWCWSCATMSQPSIVDFTSCRRVWLHENTGRVFLNFLMDFWFILFRVFVTGSVYVVLKSVVCVNDWTIGIRKLKRNIGEIWRRVLRRKLQEYRWSKNVRIIQVYSL